MGRMQEAYHQFGVLEWAVATEFFLFLLFLFCPFNHDLDHVGCRYCFMFSWLAPCGALSLSITPVLRACFSQSSEYTRNHK